ncbi:MAG TPA: hypothetical protein V6C71_07130 [Coleofasciculaceae cyanobacterium]|jgi:hypothetical protein
MYVVALAMLFPSSNESRTRKGIICDRAFTGTGIEQPDYLATIDVAPDSPTYSQIRCLAFGITNFIQI